MPLLRPHDGITRVNSDLATRGLKPTTRNEYERAARELDALETNGRVYERDLLRITEQLLAHRFKVWLAQDAKRRRTQPVPAREAPPPPTFAAALRGATQAATQDGTPDGPSQA